MPFLHLSQLQAAHPKINLRRHYSGARHGKSCDSTGRNIKNCASRAVASGKAFIQSAQDLFEFCQNNLTIKPSETCMDHVVCSFELIKEVERDAVSVDDLRCVKGTQSIHSAVPSNIEGILSVRALSFLW